MLQGQPGWPATMVQWEPLDLPARVAKLVLWDHLVRLARQAIQEWMVEWVTQVRKATFNELMTEP